ncbi:MAG: VWA domain-containing protein [Anaerolineales bacterium]|nr:VWA domain-containing protein [Anaerolineales bacterium]
MSSKRPGLILILVDQSGSMGDPYEGETKATFAAKAVNRVIYEIIRANEAGEEVKNRCSISVIGYGASVSLLVSGVIGDIAKSPARVEQIMRKVPDGAGGLVDMPWEMPIWIEPAFANGTPMAEAFELAHAEADKWVKDHTDSFPPVLINITDGQPNDMSKALSAAKELMKLRSNDGNLLLLNAHIQQAAGGEILLPISETGLQDEFSKFLFSISSELPETTLTNAKMAGFNPEGAARGFVYKAGAETLVKLLSFGSTMGDLRAEGLA